MRTTIASNVEWKAWGQKDPMMGVATRTGKERGGPNAWSDAEFYELGRADWEDFVQRWRRYGLDTSSCLEVGCGTGRITSQLARTFDKTCALDVSEGMIRYAREHVVGPNVVFMLGDGLHVDLPDASVSAIFSTHVFQHFDSIVHASSYFHELARVLKPRGTLMIHLPMHHWPAMPGVFDLLYRTRKLVGDARAWYKRRLIRFGAMHHFMRRQSYSIEYLLDRLPESGLRDVEVVIFRTSKENLTHSFILGRKHG